MVLEREDYEGCVVAVDGVYSMTGTIPPLDELDEVTRQFGGILYVDDAHGTAVFRAGGPVHQALGDQVTDFEANYNDLTVGDRIERHLLLGLGQPHFPGTRGLLGWNVDLVNERVNEPAFFADRNTAFLRLRSALPGAIKEIVADVNSQLCKDVQDSGDFMTLFYGEINAREKHMCWVSAGHDPALIFDPVTDSFESMSAKGLPLGVDDDAVYDEARHPLIPGNIIIIGTDGIWEAHDPQGEMFGKDRLQELVRTHAGQNADQIIEAVIAAVEAFQGPGGQRQDDITLTVITIELIATPDGRGVIG